MSPFDPEGHHRWQSRCERWSALLREDGQAAPLHALALDLKQNWEQRRELMAQAEALKCYRATLLAQIDRILTQIQAEMALAKQRQHPLSFSAEDMREESRLCREEAAATADMEMRRAIASRAVALAMLGEAAERLRTI